MKAQQEAYSVAGVDESVSDLIAMRLLLLRRRQTPANAVVARDERRANKRKKGEKDYTSNTLNGKASSSTGETATTTKSAPVPSAPKKTAVFVTNLPPDTNASTLSSVFSKAGVLLIGDDGEPRVKMYYDDDGRFKGEALIIYFKEGSVDLAITLLDDTELELGAGFASMRVKVAEYDKSQSANEGKKPEKKEEVKQNGDEKDKTERKKPSAEDKKRMTKRIKTMQRLVSPLLRPRSS